MVDDEDEDVLKAAGLVFDEGFDFFYSGQSDKALTAFREAYGIYQRAGVNEGQTDCLLYIAIVFSYEGRYEDVVVTYRKALRLDLITYCGLFRLAMSASFRSIGAPDSLSLRIFYTIAGSLPTGQRAFAFISSRVFRSVSRKYCPVYDLSTAATSSGVPVATTSPPRTPPSGPRSIM